MEGEVPLVCDCYLVHERGDRRSMHRKGERHLKGAGWKQLPRGARANIGEITHLMQNASRKEKGSKHPRGNLVSPEEENADRCFFFLLLISLNPCLICLYYRALRRSDKTVARSATGCSHWHFPPMPILCKSQKGWQ